MSAEGRGPQDAPAPDANLVPEPGTVRRDETGSIATTQTSGGLAAGDPAGGPRRTPDSRTVGEDEDDADRRSGGDAQVRAPEDINATPPHGDATLDP